MEPEELSDGRLVCSAHKLTICGKCCVDYSFMDDILDEDKEGESDGDELLTEEEMAAFRARMIAKKGKTSKSALGLPLNVLGCACYLPIQGSGCLNCDSLLKEKVKEQKEACASCGKKYALDEYGKGKALNSCKKCLKTKYCSRDCQKADWKAGHQNLCRKVGDKDEMMASES